MRTLLPWLLATTAHHASSIALLPPSHPIIQRSTLAHKIPDPPNAAPPRLPLPSPHKQPGAKRIKIRSGPYKIPDMTVVGSPYGDKGTLFNLPDTSIERPCEGECTILTQQAGLEFVNGELAFSFSSDGGEGNGEMGGEFCANGHVFWLGTNANIDSGLWLHHMVSFIKGPGRWDPTCYGWPSGPHLAVGATGATSERMMASGNERAFLDYSANPEGSGYHFKSTDKLAYLVDLMNMNMEANVVYVTMTYDYLEGPLPPGWLDVKTIWLDAFQCGTSEIAAPKQNGAFTVSSKPWKPNFEGKILGGMGHLHDGGIIVDTMAGPNTPMCSQDIPYSEKPEFKWSGKMAGADKPADDHISSMPQCKIQAVTQLKKDQSWTVEGKYDYDKRAGNLEGGKQSNVMAISLVFVGVPPGGVPKPGWFGR
ncbi:Diphthamide biosynthesis protein 2 [Venturia nashicola]|uniref:Diphthamide biosynthesis protein 2 n=1 Tax=Venturia nashicola TaxID=86259 RepID=A0A4Z1P8I1_9PEZI|nr:Diphthamide biosynthesis protein 2 [Venturia nashicola]